MTHQIVYTGRTPDQLRQQIQDAFAEILRLDQECLALKQSSGTSDAYLRRIGDLQLAKIRLHQIESAYERMMRSSQETAEPPVHGQSRL